MFSKVAIAISFALAAVAQQCNTGPVQCCNYVGKTDEPSIAKELGLLGIVLDNVNVPVGLQCTPITVIGVGSPSACNASPVCCTGNTFNGLVNVGCTGVSL